MKTVQNAVQNAGHGPTGPSESAAVEGRFMARAKPGEGESPTSTPEEMAQKARRDAEYRKALAPANPRRAEEAGALVLRHLQESCASTGREQYSTMQLIPQQLEIQARPGGHGDLIRKLGDRDPELDWANFTLMYYQEKQTALELGLLMEQIQTEGISGGVQERALELTAATVGVADMYHRVHRDPESGLFALRTAKMWLGKHGFNPVQVEDMTHGQAADRARELERTLEESCGKNPQGHRFPAYAVAYFATRRTTVSLLERDRSNRPCGEEGARQKVNEMTKLAYAAFLPAALADE